MIIVGYQGIGKSSLASSKTGYIDLESSNFFVDGKRDENWYIPYCNIAQHLSEQGYHVFTSSHEVVRNQLKNSNETKVIVYPSLDLKDKWIDKLRLRYEVTKTDKNYKAYMNAVDRYVENIKELMKEDDFCRIEIKSIDYDLAELLNPSSWFFKNAYREFCMIKR